MGKEILIEWLTNPNKRPLSQEEFSRRNYVRKTFAWNEESQTLRAVAKKGESKDRTVITTDGMRRGKMSVLHTTAFCDRTLSFYSSNVSTAPASPPNVPKAPQPYLHTSNRPATSSITTCILVMRSM